MPLKYQVQQAARQISLTGFRRRTRPWRLHSSLALPRLPTGNGGAHASRGGRFSRAAPGQVLTINPRSSGAKTEIGSSQDRQGLSHCRPRRFPGCRAAPAGPAHDRETGLFFF